jgi:uncharacterized protein (UPF0147 family)
MPSNKEEITNIIEALKEIEGDMTVPKNVRLKITEIITTLQEETELSLKVNKALHQLDEIADDMNLHSYARTQIWNIASSLEKL